MVSFIIVIAEALIIAALVIIIICQRIKHMHECDELLIACEDERILRDVEKACSKIFHDHSKAQYDKEIALLKEALHNSEKKRKELCTRLWEEEKLK